jgi:anti-anti-sigma factor
VEASAALTSGRLEVVPASAGAYDPRWQQGVLQAAFDDGYPEVRWSGQASTAWGVMTPSEHRSVEVATDELCGPGVSVLCQYSFEEAGAALAEISRLHSAGVREGSLTAVPTREGLALAGEADLSNHEVLGAALSSAARRPPRGRLVLDLGGLEFLDIGACRTLLAATDGYRRRGGRVEIRRGPRRVARVLRLLGTVDEIGLSLEEG